MKAKTFLAGVFLALLLPACAGAGAPASEGTPSAEALLEERIALEKELAALEEKKSELKFLEGQKSAAEALEKEWQAKSAEKINMAVVFFKEIPEYFSSLNEGVALYKNAQLPDEAGARAGLSALLEKDGAALTLLYAGGLLLLEINLPELEPQTMKWEEMRAKSFSVVKSAAESMETLVPCARALGCGAALLRTPSDISLFVDIDREIVALQTETGSAALVRDFLEGGGAE